VTGYFLLTDKKGGGRKEKVSFFLYYRIRTLEVVKCENCPRDIPFLPEEEELIFSPFLWSITPDTIKACGRWELGPGKRLTSTTVKKRESKRDSGCRIRFDDIN
jgi:hypothetical protein